ncbi:MAG: hypothetical protein IJ335_01025 [Lachnospiraceae bacterium]|nr:hypothetical protein [Lachnospiraceae bacterium]
MKSKKNVIGQYLLFLLGLFIASMGVAFSTKAGLGTSPVASVPYSVSLVCSIFTLGGWLNLLGVLQISVQVLLLGKKCKPLEIIIQTVLAFAYGYMTDFSCWLIKGIKVATYIEQLIYMLLSCIILAFGIWIQLKGAVAMLPGEAMNRAISMVTGKKYENVKIFFDIFYILIAAIICLAFIGRLEGVREGSIFAAIMVGNIIRFYNYIYGKIIERK